MRAWDRFQHWFSWRVWDHWVTGRTVRVMDRDDWTRRWVCLKEEDVGRIRNGDLVSLSRQGYEPAMIHEVLVDPAFQPR